MVAFSLQTKSEEQNVIYFKNMIKIDPKIFVSESFELVHAI